MGTSVVGRSEGSPRAARGRRAGIALGLAVVAGAMALAHLAQGCQSQPMSSSGAAEAHRKSRIPIAEELLRSHGLETVWYNESRGGNSEGVYSVDLLGDSLYLTTAATSARSGYLTRILRSNGETKWHYPLTDPIRKGPNTFQYPGSPAGRSC